MRVNIKKEDQIWITKLIMIVDLLTHNVMLIITNPVPKPMPVNPNTVINMKVMPISYHETQEHKIILHKVKFKITKIHIENHKRVNSDKMQTISVVTKDNKIWIAIDKLQNRRKRKNRPCFIILLNFQFDQFYFACRCCTFSRVNYNTKYR